MRTKASGIGVIEVLSTSEMSSDKVAQLEKNNIPYVEVKGNHDDLT